MDIADLALLKGLVVGHGIDVVDLDDFSRLLREPMSQYLDKHFTADEMAYAERHEDRLAKLAGRFALKEAVMKALHVGWGSGIGFTDVEVVTLPSGAPQVRLHRRLREIEVERGITGWLVSSSHAGKIAIASVIALSDAS